MASLRARKNGSGGSFKPNGGSFAPNGGSFKPNGGAIAHINNGRFTYLATRQFSGRGMDDALIY